jgi:hypothetical protein
VSDEDEGGDRVGHWAVIAQAEGVLAARYGITVAGAAQVLIRDARSIERPIHEVARAVLDVRSAGFDETRDPADLRTGLGPHECGGAGG